MFNKLRCRLFGHGPFYQELLYEDSTIHYRVELRDKYGRAWGWPTCFRCGWKVVTMKWLEPIEVYKNTLPLDKHLLDEVTSQTG